VTLNLEINSNNFYGFSDLLQSYVSPDDGLA